MTAQSTGGFTMPKRIPLTQGRVAIVNNADYEGLSQHKWYATKGGAVWYAKRDERGKTVLMHQLILNPPVGTESDHINGDGLDNRRSNLRLCTHAQNQMNSRKRTNCSSQYKGVDWDKSHCKWRARIMADGKRHHLGYFDDEIDAARAYNKAAKKGFGEFAKLNAI